VSKKKVYNQTFRSASEAFARIHGAKKKEKTREQQRHESLFYSDEKIRKKRVETFLRWTPTNAFFPLCELVLHAEGGRLLWYFFSFAAQKYDQRD
jgi:hypothetical protein